MAMTAEDIFSFKCCGGQSSTSKSVLSRGLTFHKNNCPVLVGMRIYQAYHEMSYYQAVVYVVDELTKWKESK